MDSAPLVCPGALEPPVSQQFSAASRKQMRALPHVTSYLHAPENREGGSRSGLLELHSGQGTLFASGGSWEAAGPPMCPEFAAGKPLSPAPLPARLSGWRWRGLSHS